MSPPAGRLLHDDALSVSLRADAVTKTLSVPGQIDVHLRLDRMNVDRDTCRKTKGPDPETKLVLD